jgi:hypothetical protein
MFNPSAAFFAQGTQREYIQTSSCSSLCISESPGPILIKFGIIYLCCICILNLYQMLLYVLQTLSVLDKAVFSMSYESKFAKSGY